MRTDLLVVGAGPFGLALAAEATHQGLPTVVVGRPMSFWTDHMPAGMLLRSACDWHLDTEGTATIEAFLATRGLVPAQVEPLSRELYLDYCAWFIDQKQLAPVPQHVRALSREGREARTAGPVSGRSSQSSPLEEGSFVATLDDGSEIRARSVALALGMGPHRRVPTDLVELLPPGSWQHTCDAVDLSAAAGRRYLLVGGRQSAFEWAALLVEAGARSVEIAHRHESPSFAAADWRWVTPVVDRLTEDPGWFARLPADEQAAYRARLWAEGRLKVEPWLADRLPADRVRVRPRRRLTACTRAEDGSLTVTYDDGAWTQVEQVLLATGYAPHVDDIAFLRGGNLPPLAQAAGLPELDDAFQTSVPGLYLTSLPATAHFGPFFGFTIAARMSATVIVRDLLASQLPDPARSMGRAGSDSSSATPGDVTDAAPIPAQATASETPSSTP